METHDMARQILGMNPVYRISDGEGVFSAEEILAANRRHDRQYGWSFLWPAVFTNNARLPETVVGELGWEPLPHQPPDQALQP